MDSIEDWLALHCQGEWDVRFGGIVETDEGIIRKQLDVMFEKIEDKTSFRDQFLTHGDAGAAGVSYRG
ncbi:hypothetical protein [Varunaivibrio sulfuroxidans]|nr:hypothetical protein [Varunaivibrio sulfuroxidans]WES31073.1 hypothetical protein P3M64_01455 [Varunaivibrio sulfuroxidans]